MSDHPYRRDRAKPIVSDEAEIAAIALMAHWKQRLESVCLAVGVGIGLFVAMISLAFMPTLLILETRVLGDASVVGTMAIGLLIPTLVATGVGRMLVRARRSAWQRRAMAETGVPPDRIGWVV
jgi:hypothetical protein